MDDQAKADHYREQAENLRKLAEQDGNAATREALLSVALSYDRLSAKFSAQARVQTP